MDEYPIFRKPWRRALLIKVLGRHYISCSGGTVKVSLKTPYGMWNDSFGAWVCDYSLFSKAYYLLVLVERSYVAMGHYFTVFTQRPDFFPSVATITSTLIWVRFSKIPIEFSILKFSIDGESNWESRYGWWRYCFSHSGSLGSCLCRSWLEQATGSRIHLIGRIQRVQYERLHIIYFQCGKYCHRTENCPHVKSILFKESTPCTSYVEFWFSSPVIPQHQHLGSATGFGP